MKGIICLKDKIWNVKINSFKEIYFKLVPEDITSELCIENQKVNFFLIRWCNKHQRVMENCKGACFLLRKPIEFRAKLISKDETEHLISSEANKKRLEESILQLKSKPFYAANVRDLLDLYYQEEISMSKFVEELNNIARRFYEK